MTYTVSGLVRGRVQGVGFRFFVRTKALEHNLVGWAKNLPDGTVEVFLQGERKKVNYIQHQVSIGPPGSDVRSLEWQVIESLDCADFTIR